MSPTRCVRGFVAGVALLCLPPAGAGADDFSDVGYIDQAALSNSPAFSKASAQMDSYKEQLEKQLGEELRAASGAAEQQRIAQTFSQKIEERKRALLAPLFTRAQTAIASVASSKSLSIVLDKRIVITGGQDVTRNVADLLAGIGDPVAPASTPPPSEIGFVDQERIDKIPAVKRASDAFANVRAVEEQNVKTAMRTAKTPAEKQALLQAYQARLADKQKRMIGPLLTRTRGAIADVAGKKKVLLVVDRGDVVYGGTDLTGDVVKELSN